MILNSRLVFSKLFYSSTVWSGTSKENICKRILTNTKKFDHITPVLHKLGWLTIEELLRLRDVTMIFKCLKFKHQACRTLRNSLVLHLTEQST